MDSRAAIRVSPLPANRPALPCLCSPPACSAMSAYFSEVLALGDRMLERLALALGLPQGW